MVMIKVLIEACCVAAAQVILNTVERAGRAARVRSSNRVPEIETDGVRYVYR